MLSDVDQYVLFKRLDGNKTENDLGNASPINERYELEGIGNTSARQK
jgi:hypothetical protein